jgi:hypothetical protein
MKAILIGIMTLLPIFTGSFFKGQTTKETNKNEIFKPGEMLKYEMSYGWIKGGEASLNLEKVKYRGKDAYHVRAVGKTTGIAHSLYNVRDVYESYFDPVTGKPFKSMMNLKEGKYRNYNEVYYHHSSGTITSKKSGKKKLEKKDVFDIVSAFYHLRRSLSNLKVNEKVVIHTYFHDEPWDLVVRFKGYQTIKTELGKITCMKFKPIVEEGTFESEDALDIWISADRNRVPIRVKMKLFVGSFKTDLTGYEGLTHPINFIKK